MPTAMFEYAEPTQEWRIERDSGASESSLPPALPFQHTQAALSAMKSEVARLEKELHDKQAAELRSAASQRTNDPINPGAQFSMAPAGAQKASAIDAATVVVASTKRTVTALEAEMKRKLAALEQEQVRVSLDELDLEADK